MTIENSAATTWLRIDEAGDVAASLDALAVALVRAAGGKYGAWKWALIAAHASWSGAAVVALSRDAHHDAFDDKQRKAWLAWQAKEPHERGPPPDLDWLAGPRNLLSRIQAAEFMAYGGGREVDLSKNENDALSWLIGMRDELIHFKPATWSIHLESCKFSCAVAASLTADLMLGHPGVASRLTADQQQLFRKRFGEVKVALESMGTKPIIVPK